MKSWIYFVCIIGLLNSAYAQDNVYREALQQYEDARYDSALTLANKIKADTTSFDILKLKADIYAALYIPQTAAEYYKRAIAVGEKEKSTNTSDLIEAYIVQGENYLSLSLFDQAIKSSKKALYLAVREHDETSEANAMYNMSTALVRKGLYDSAIHYIQKVYTIDLKLGDSSAISSDFNTLGYLHMQNEEFEKGLDYYEQSLAYLNPKKDSLQIGIRISNIAFAKMEMGKYEESRTDFQQAISIFEALNATRQVVKQYINLGSLYNKTQKYEQALSYQEKALAYAEAIDDDFFRIRTKIQMMQSLISLRQLQKAETIAQESIAIAKRANYLEELVQVYQLLSQIHELVGNNQKAFSTLKEYILYRDSLQKKQQLSKIHDLELRMISQQKEKEIEVLALQNEISEQALAREKRNILFLAIGLMLSIVAIFIILTLHKQKIKLKEMVYSKEIDELKLEIKTLVGKYEGSLEVTLEKINERLVTPLSQREYDVFKQIFSQKTNSEIAEELYVSINTVKTHLKNLYSKLGVSNRKEALDIVLRSE